MKTMVKMLIAMMALALVVLAFSGCDFTLQDECEHVFADATCEEPKTCTLCKATEGEALGHTEEILMGKDATCTEAGLTDGKKCSTCGEILVAQEEIDALGHTEEIMQGEAPTCTSTGLTDGKKCSVCYEILVAQEEIPVVAHTEEVVAGKEATCTETGLTDGKKCSVCGEITVAQEIISAEGHKDENKDFECDVCFVDLCTEHVLAEAVEENRVEATCTSKGSYELVVKCSQCGEEISRETKEIAELPHSEEVIAGKKATCTYTGLTDGKKCSACGEIIVAQEEIPMLAHSEEILASREATCTESGLTEGKKCSVCGEILVAQEEIPMIAHTEEIVAGKAATCIEAGLTEGKKCSACGKVTVAQEEIAALGHKWNDGETVMSVTTYTCTVCSVKKAESTDELENVENIFSGKQFVGTDDANAQVLIAGWFAGGGYDKLTDGVKDQEQVGRFSTKLNKTTAFVDGSIDLGEKYVLGTLRFYLYDTKDSITEAAKKESIGKDMLIQVYVDGAWYDVVRCSDNATLCKYLVINEGLNNDYLEFDLSDIVAEKIRFYISASISGNGITYQEIECSGARLNEHVHTEVILPASVATCLKSGLTEGKFCSVCNEVLMAQEVVPALGHAWDNGVTVDGITTHTCANCQLTKVVSEGSENIENILSGKVFTPTEEALTHVLSASWWKGSGYVGLTDGIKNADNAPGRFATAMNASALMDATVDLAGEYALGAVRFYTYDNGTTNVGSLGKDLLIQVYANGEWKDAVVCVDNTALASYLVVNEGAYNDYLEFDLSGIVAEKIRFYISASASSSGTSYEEIECSAKLLAEPEEPVFIENIFAGKQFTPTEEAKASVLVKSWWKGSGYEGLTDSIKNADNAPGRFSTIMATTGMMDATIDLGGEYELHSLKFYTYDPAAGTGAGSLGASLLVQVYADGEWKDVVVCADNATLASYLVVNDGTFNDYLEFDLGGIKAEKVRFYITASASSSGTTYEEIECNGYAK